ncbi:MAG TPA: lectin like domain-containing protein [Methanocorpusculum sp.]|nr:lectin like domain-containing protein [Methanocorpusculum sp.]HJK79741.1 lectin like domain-containing protein [Methanocorpusculum sp.]
MNKRYFGTVIFVSFAVLLMLLFAVTPVAADESLSTVSEYGYIDDGYIPPDSDQDIGTVVPGLSLPAEYLLNQNLPLQHQGTYGTCWAFAATTSASSNLMMKGFSYVNFSKHQLAYFTYHRDNITNMTPIAGLEGLKGDKIIPNYSRALKKYPNYMGLGGFQTTVTFTLASWTGLVNEEDAPYHEVDTNKGLPTSLAIDADTYILANAAWVNIQDRPEIKYMLQTRGAAAVEINVSTTYMNYSDNKNWPALYCGDGFDSDHAVTLIGWDDNFDKSNFNSSNQLPTGNGAWLIQNSWGESFASYIWVSYYDRALREAYFYDMIPADTYKKNYQYDGGALHNVTCYPGCSRISMANVFTASGSDRIDAVSFFTNNSDVKYEIEIYTDLTDDAVPTSGSLKTHQPGSLQFAGYATVPLTEPVELIKGQKFSVVIILSKEFLKEGEELEIVVDTTSGTHKDSFHSETYAEPGQSFSRSDGTPWWDLSEDHSTNVRVKAFTNFYTPYLPKFDSATGTTEEITIPPAAGQVETNVSVQGKGDTRAEVIIASLKTDVLPPLPPDIPEKSVMIALDISVRYLEPTTPGGEYSFTFTLPRTTTEGKAIKILHHTGGVWEECRYTVDASGDVWTYTVYTKSFSPFAVTAAAIPAPAGDGNMQNAYRILFETSGGSFISPVTDLSSGDVIKEPPAPTRDGYTFGGWYQDEDCTKAWNFTKPIDGDMALYAKWRSAADVPAASATAVTTQPTVQATTAAPSVEDSLPSTTPTQAAVTETAAGVRPTLAQASAPVCGVIAGLLAAAVLLRRKE